MIECNWSKLNSKQLGCMGEYYAKMVFLSYGWYVYTPEVDDHGVDFIAENPDREKIFRVQVKSVSKDTLNIQKNKIVINDNWLLCYLRFKDGELPDVYLWKTSEWNNEKNKEILGENNYEHADSEPEWNVKYSKTNAQKFDKFRIEDSIMQL